MYLHAMWKRTDNASAFIEKENKELVTEVKLLHT